VAERIMNRALAQCRRDVLAVFRRALDAVHGRDVVAAYLRKRADDQPVYVLALGKAAAAMAAGAFSVYGDRMQAAWVITKHAHAPAAHEQLPRTRYLEAGHPEPDAHSLEAGRVLLEFTARVPPRTRLLVLLSGGASALAEVLPAGIDLEQLQRVNRWLLGSGLDIAHVNAVRKSLSCIKGGRLIRHLHGIDTDVLLISDVPGDDPAVIGSGPLFPDQTTPALLKEFSLPAWLDAMLRVAPPMPAIDEPAFGLVHSCVVANNEMARHAAAMTARTLGYSVIEHGELLEGDVRVVVERIAATILHAPPALHIWGGETTLRLPDTPGRGGRNQHLALSVAIRIAGRRDIVFLAGGSDGTDGNTDNMGAVVDGATVARGAARGLDADAHLARADSATFLDASGDAIRTGPTGTNVMDLMIGLRFDGPT
jgi:hydroxypyruvate reductase